MADEVEVKEAWRLADRDVKMATAGCRSVDHPLKVSDAETCLNKEKSTWLEGSNIW